MHAVELEPATSGLKRPAAATPTGPTRRSAILSLSPPLTADARRVARAALVAVMPGDTCACALAACLTWRRTETTRRAGLGRSGSEVAREATRA
eukprot:7382734-Prymnesium_polylepis.3